MFVVWALTGMWHGASWNYIFWGLYFFVFLVLEKHVLKDRLEHWNTVLRHFLVLLIIYFGWVLFKFDNLSLLGTAFKGMFGLNGNGFFDHSVGLLFKNNVFFLIFCCVAVTPLGKMLGNMLKNLGKRSKPWMYIQGVWEVACPLLLMVLSMMALAGNSYNPFLYFQF